MTWMELRTISWAARRSAPVFIVGMPRSGTSLLYRLLQRHSRFLPREENLVESKVVRHLGTLPWTLETLPESLQRYMMGDRERIVGFLTSIEPLRPVIRATRRGERLVRRASRGRRGWPVAVSPYPVVLRSYFHHARLARGCQRVVEKTPRHVFHVPLLGRAFPLARFLHLNRHPVDVYSSYRRRAKVDPGATWADIPPGRFCSRYAAINRAGLVAAETMPDRVLAVPYEEVTRASEAAIRRILTFLGEPYEPEILAGSASPQRRHRRVPELVSPPVARTKEWRDYVSEEDAAFVEERLGALMSRWGYERYTATPAG